jgi:hypothetical protein
MCWIYSVFLLLELHKFLESNTSFALKMGSGVRDDFIAPLHHEHRDTVACVFAVSAPAAGRPVGHQQHVLTFYQLNRLWTLQYIYLCDIIMLQVTWLLLTLILYSESRIIVKRSFNDQSVRGYLTEVLPPFISYSLTQRRRKYSTRRTARTRINLYLMLRLRMRGAVPPLPLYAFKVQKTVKFSPPTS